MRFGFLRMRRSTHDEREMLGNNVIVARPIREVLARRKREVVGGETESCALDRLQSQTLQQLVIATTRCQETDRRAPTYSNIVKRKSNICSIKNYTNIDTGTCTCSMYV